LQDKNARKEQFVINEKANISEVQTKEEELKLKVQELKDELEVQKEQLIDSYEYKMK
jgi:hypothetical protein